MKLRASFLAAAVTLSIAAPASADTTPPVPSFDMPNEVRDDLVVTFDEPVRSVSSDNVILRASGSSSRLSASTLCFAAGVGISCDDGPVDEVRVSPRNPLIPGQRYAGTVNPAGVAPMTDVAGNAPPKTTKTGRATVSEQESTPAASRSWRRVKNPRAIGDSYRTERARGAKVTLRFTGTEVTWYTRKAPSQGKAWVYLDGTRIATVNNYSATTAFKVPRTFRATSAGKHRLTVKVLGIKGSSRGTGAWVTADSWRVDGSFAGGAIFNWDAVRDTDASADRYIRSDAPRAKFTMRFRGRGIDWHTVAGPGQGTAHIYIDGSYVKTVDNQASTRRMLRRTFRGLSDDVHRLTIVVAGGGSVAVDRLYVRLYSRAMFKPLGAWIDLWDYNIDISAATRRMKDEGVRTLYLQTARYNSDADFKDAARAGAWLESAHARGIKVVGWYLTAYDQHLDKDVRRTVAIRTFRSPKGERFDALAVDIEYKGEVESLEEFNEGIVEHLRRVRAAVGTGYPIGAITPSPVGMGMSPSSWTGFPWSSIGRLSDVVLPMAYWSYRTTCDTNPDHCAYGYARKNTSQARRYTGLPVHVIGGIGNEVTTREVSDFVRGAQDEKAYGGSLYDYRTTRDSFWAPLRGFNDL